MKVCEGCGVEIFTLDGDNLCGECERLEMSSSVLDKQVRAARNTARRKRRAEVREVYESLGLKRVRGALGGIYYE